MFTAFTSLASVLVTISLGYLVVIAAAAVAGALARGGRRERAVDAYEALAVSRFTIPVSLIVPCDGDHAELSATVKGLLGLNYPELEVIVVADAGSAATMNALKREWALDPKEFFYRRTLTTGAVHRIYGSADDARLVVVEKAGGGRADALNCGVSLARFRYVVSVPPGVVFDQDALLRLMSPALQDPATVLAVTSYVERRGGGEGAGDAVEWARAGDDYQRLASIRSWMASRLAWHQLRCGVPPRDGVAAWRRDAILERGGFSVDAPDPELDLLIRFQTSNTEGGIGRVVRTSEVFGHMRTSSIEHASANARRRRRGLRTALMTLWGSRASGGTRLMMMIVLAVEAMTPAVQMFVVAAVLIGTGTGLAGWRTPFLTMLFLTFGYGLVSAAALLLRGGTPGAPGGKDLKRLLLRAPLEFVVYRPAIVWASLSGRGAAD